MLKVSTFDTYHIYNLKWRTDQH